MLPPILVKAEQLAQEKRFKEAAGLYDRVIAQNEQNPYIVVGLAQTWMQDPEHIGAAIALFHYAIRLFGKKVPFECYMNLGLTYKFSGQLEKAIKWLKKAVDTEENAASLGNYGQVFVETDEPERGLMALEKSIKFDPGHALAHWNLSLALLSRARETDGWERAWEEYEWGCKPGGGRALQKNLAIPYWDGTPGKRVVVSGEQGIGDEVMFSSMLPDLMRDCEVLLDCHPRLTTLFENSFGVKCFGTRKDKEADWIEAEKPDAMIPMGSLGKFYRKKNADFHGMPYLKADPLPRGERFRVGISWSGGRLAPRVAKRTVPLNWWRSILDVPECEFVSLQYTDCAAEIASVEALGYTIRQYPEAQADDYNETARLVASCDLVISVCTSIIHLAGALGVPTWVMVPRAPAWRYQKSGAMPWYRSVRLYRQPQEHPDAWGDVVSKVGLDLSDLMDQRRRKAA